MSDTKKPKLASLAWSAPLEAEEVYASLRDARLNEIFHARQLASIQSRAMWLDILIALGTGGTLAATAAAKSPNGQVAMMLLAAAAAIAAIAKPIFRFGEKIESHSKLLQGWREVFNVLRRMAADMKAHQSIRAELVPLYAEIADRMDTLQAAEISEPSSEVRIAIQKEVNEEMPHDSLWWPTDPATTEAA